MPHAPLDGKRALIVRTAKMRNVILVTAGYEGARVPQCELDGTRDKTARLAFLACADVSFTRSDRSMVVRHLGRKGGWWSVTDDRIVGLYRTKEAALVAARKAERPPTFRAARPPRVLVEAADGARERDSRRATDLASLRITDGSYGP